MRSWMQEAALEASNVFIHCCYITGRFFAVTHHWVELTLSSTVEPKRLCTVLRCRQELWRSEGFLLSSSRREDFLALLNSAMMDRDIKGKNNYVPGSLDHYYNVQKNKNKTAFGSKSTLKKTNPVDTDAYSICVFVCACVCLCECVWCCVRDVSVLEDEMIM